MCETSANVDGFFGQLDNGSLKGATALLASARRMRVHGVRQFHSMASFLTYCLGMVRSDVTLLDAPHLGVAEALSQLEPGDVVIVAICAPYTRSVAEVGRIAAANGQSVIAITDSLSSTLVPPAEHAFSFLMPAASIRTAWAAMSYSARHCSTSSPASLATRR